MANSGFWRMKEKPPISLIVAVKLAAESLNKGGDDFYCLRADVLRDGGRCVWDLDFGSTNGVMRWVEVGADKSITVRKDGPFTHD
jgi:hypothetical protein